MDNIYLPEGFGNRGFNGAVFSGGVEELESARLNETIFEAKAVLCDSQHNLHVDLGGYKGIIPKDEAVYNPSGEAVKDIAIITRVGKNVCFVVTGIEKSVSGITVLLSRRLAQKKCCERYISQLNPGDVIDVSVTHMEPFGVFCDIGCGMIALLPIDCVSVSRIGHPSERFSCGQKIKCVIRSMERDICRVTLTHKELLGTWQENAASFSAGETVTGVIRSVEPYGIFVELSPNLAGLAEWCDGAEVGKMAAVYIKSIIPEKMKIKLVIVDTSDEQLSRSEEVYYFEGEHMDGWRYSPEGCSKEIYTFF